MVSFFTIHGSYCWVGSLMPLSSFHMKLFFTNILRRHCQIICSQDDPPESIWVLFQSNLRHLRLSFHGIRAFFVGYLDDWRISTWGFTSIFITRTAIAMRGLVICLWIWWYWIFSCAWDPCLHWWVDQTNDQSVHRRVPPSAGISIFNRKSRITKSMRGFNRMKINGARLYTSNLQNFRQSRSLNCRAGLLHWNHSLLVCVYNIQHKWKNVKGFCEKNAK